MIKGKDKIRLAEALAFFNRIEVDQSQNYAYVSFKLKSQSSFISSVHIDLDLEIFDLLCN